jgi:hypothetical protein
MTDRVELTHMRKVLQLLDRSISTAILARDRLSKLCMEEEEWEGGEEQ